MPTRTKKGAELARRTLGFRRYIDVAETERMRFAARQGIFAAYLPFAIAFGNVAQWARAFTPVEIAVGTAGWYAGDPITTGRDIDAFSNGITGAAVGAIWTPSVDTGGGRGESGFDSGGGGGGSSGGGGGGGGGGSW